MSEYTDENGRRFVLTEQFRFVARESGMAGRAPYRVLQQRRCYAGPIEDAYEWHDVPTCEESDNGPPFKPL